MPFALLDDQFTTLHAHSVNDVGDVVGSFSSPPTWSVDRPDLLTLAPAADGATCRVDTIAGAFGDATVTCSADGKTDAFPISVSANPDVSGLNITADPPQSRLAPADDATPAPPP